MEEKELEKILAKAAENNGQAIAAAVKKEMTEAAKGLMTLDAFEGKLKEHGMSKETIKSLTDAIAEQGVSIAKMIEGKNVSNETDIEKVLFEKQRELMTLSKSEAASSHNNVSLKIANKTLVQRSDVAASTLGLRLAGVGQLPTRNMAMSTIFPTVNYTAQEVQDSNGVIRYIDQAAVTRAAAPVAEGAVKSEAAISWVDRSINFQTIAEHIPVTKQAYRNLSFVAKEIENLLYRDLALAEGQQLYSGTGVSPQLKGLLTSAPAVVTANLPRAGGVDNANIYDLIASLSVYVSNGQLGTGKQSKYMANKVLINPIDVLRYKLAKAVDGHYLLPPFIAADGTTVAGVQVVEDPLVAANSLVIGDFTYGTIYREETANITMGFINDQFVRNQWTILAEQVMALLIRVVDEDAFVRVPNITTALAALETP